MRAVCVDDEREQLEESSALLAALPGIDAVERFTDAAGALEWLASNRAELALLDINMPGMNGIELAARIKTRYPHMAVIFLTACPQYAMEAFELRVSGYILKPATRERLESEISCALFQKPERPKSRVTARTFGAFELFVDGEPVAFRQSRCKELLAYLIDRRGSGVTRAEAFAMLWEDRAYDRPMQKQLDAVIRGLRTSLREYGVDSLFEMKGGTMRIRPEQLQCDLYLFCEGDPAAIGEYRGEYMSGYAWAELTGAYMSGRLGNRAASSLPE